MNFGTSTDTKDWRVEMFIDGNQWCVLWGPDLQIGVAGFGVTLRLAIYDFEKNFAEEQERKRRIDNA